MPQLSEARVREFFGAFSRRDFAAAASMFSNDVVLHVPGRNPFSGTIYGRDAWLASLSKYVEAERAGISLAFEVHDVVGGSAHAVALLSVRAERGGERIEWQRAAVYHLAEGEIQEVWIHDVDQYAIDEFFSRVGLG